MAHDQNLEDIVAWGCCQYCELISQGWGPGPGFKRLCPNCGTTEIPIPWPDLLAEGILDKAFAMKPQDYEDCAVVGTLVASALEVMLEVTTICILEYFSGRSQNGRKLADYILSRTQGVEARLELIKDLAGVSLKTIAGQIGEPQFPKQWKELREARNKFVHSGESCAFEPDQELKMLSIVQAATKVLAAANNQVLAGTR